VVPVYVRGEGNHQVRVQFESGFDLEKGGGSMVMGASSRLVLKWYLRIMCGWGTRLGLEYYRDVSVGGVGGWGVGGWGGGGEQADGHQQQVGVEVVPVRYLGGGGAGGVVVVCAGRREAIRVGFQTVITGRGKGGHTGW
jgi:hypothetical protein